MDPSPFVRVIVGNLVLHIPAEAAEQQAVKPTFCKIKLNGGGAAFPPQFAPVPGISHLPADGSVGRTLQAQGFSPSAATFHLNRADMEKLAGKMRSFFRPSKGLSITVSIYGDNYSCGVKSRKLMGKVTVPLKLSGAETKSVISHNGWVNAGSTRFHLNIRSEPDPRYVLKFDGEPQLSPQVLQIHGTTLQPVFTCKFGFRSNPDRNQPARLEHSFSRVWSFGSDHERSKERKGWSVTVHDLSGSAVAAASIVTPFVPSPGTDRVSRANPGAWLILRPSGATWKPWGRLEAWRERGGEGLGFRFELIPEQGTSATSILLAETTVSTKSGGKFVIDLGAIGKSTPGSATSTPAVSPRSSADYGGSWPHSVHRGFVMSATVPAERRAGEKNNPRVEISVQHVSYLEDAAVFVALSAAVHLSMEACRPFSQKLCKELIPPPELVL